MGIWRREEMLYNELGDDRRANIDIVSSAYASMLGDKSYVSMAITTGRRYYDVLDRYGVKTVEELEKKRPGALREEIILPNIEEGSDFAKRIAPELGSSVVVPGIFGARKQRWTQDEYMVLWLRLITSSTKDVFMSDGWEYSDGGSIELTRAFMIQFHFIEERADRMPVYDHRKQPLTIEEGASKLATAIKDLARRGYPTDILRKELGRLAGIAAYCYDGFTDLHEWAYHATYRGINHRLVVEAAKSVGAPIALTWD